MKHQQMYIEYLKEEGFIPKVDYDNDIVFKYEGKTFLINIDERDEQYFRLILPNFWSIDDTTEMSKALKVANDVNTSTKVATIIIVRDHVWAVAEMFIDGTPEIDDFFKRTLDLVKLAADRFSKGMQGEQFDILRHLLKN
jgi:hypothetical protein